MLSKRNIMQATHVIFNFPVSIGWQKYNTHTDKIKIKMYFIWPTRPRSKMLSFQHVINTKVLVRYYIPLFPYQVWSLVATWNKEHMTVWTCHISRAHEACWLAATRAGTTGPDDLGKTQTTSMVWALEGTGYLSLDTLSYCLNCQIYELLFQEFFFK